MATRAVLYDGVTASRQSVIVEATIGGISIAHEDGRFEDIPTTSLRRESKDGSAMRLSRVDIEGWRLILPTPLDDDIEAVLPGAQRYGGLIDRIGLVPALLALGVIAAAILLAAYAAPKWIAPIVPYAWEENVGDAIVGDFGDRRCKSAEADAAVLALIERIDPDPSAGEIEVAILDLPWENAAALPGGHVVLFDGAIEEWDNPDALAGVIAHEVAHVRERHVAEAMVRELGIGAILRLFADDFGANAQAIVSLSYTRDNESEADEKAIAMMRKANIDPRPVADLFDRFAKTDGDESWTEFLSSHPMSRNRANNFRKAANKSASYRPAFTPAEWNAIKNACPAKVRKEVTR